MKVSNVLRLSCAIKREPGRSEHEAVEIDSFGPAGLVPWLLDCGLTCDGISNSVTDPSRHFMRPAGVVASSWVVDRVTVDEGAEGSKGVRFCPVR